MKKIKKSLDFLKILKFIFTLTAFTCINSLSSVRGPYSNALLASLISLKTNPFYSFILYFSSFLILKEFGLLLHALFSGVFFILVYYIYKKFNVKSKAEFVIYTAFSIVLFLFVGDTNNQIDFNSRLISSIITVLISFFFIVAVYAIDKKGFKFKLSKEEIFSVSLFFICLSLGLCNVFSPLVYRSISLFLLLLLVYSTPSGTGVLSSIVLSFPLCVYFSSINYISIYVFLAVTIVCFKSISKYLSSLAVFLIDFLLQRFFNVYQVYDYSFIIASGIGIGIFCLLPNQLLNKVKDTFCLFREKQLVKQAINRNRLYLSNKLYELSSVFSEMGNAFENFSKSQLSEDKAKEIFVKKISKELCDNCAFKHNCIDKKDELALHFDKLSFIGFAKGKLSLIDLPNNFLDICLRPNDVIFYTNKFLSEFRIKNIENSNTENGRKLLKNEAEELSEILKALALDSGKTLKYHSKLEKILQENLMRKGFIANEILIYGSEKNITVTLILSANEFSLTHLNHVIDSTLGFKTEITEKVNLSENKIYISFDKQTPYDAVFGVSKVAKDEYGISGDTYSVTKISNNKFLVALSDGMGSGRKAEEISSVSLSLIESFYKAGMNSQSILNTVNKLLSLYTDDCFTALDVCVIDLQTKTTDFIKYGSPYGFIVNDTGVRIIEGNSLPLGILSELKPSVCQDQLKEGDIVLLISDGISDSFGSSSDLIEYLRKIPAKNPQALTDRILNKALENTRGIKNDDMTALAVRIFKK